MTAALTDLSRCAIHTITTKPWSLAESIAKFTAAGVTGISVWRDALKPMGPADAGTMLADAGMSVPALVRGGFFPSADPAKRQAAIDENRVCLDEAAAIGAEMVVLVVGAEVGLALPEARKQVADGIAACLDHAKATGVKLAIEPLHPMYAAERSCVNRMAEAREIIEQLGSEHLGLAVDVYHVWWDPDLQAEIARAGENGSLLAFHVCDWRVPTRDMLNDRGLMGEGAIPIRKIRGWVEDAGFRGYNEVEIFSTEYWAMDQDAWLAKITEAYLASV